MGQSQSNPRKLTVINDEATGVIKISESVINRLKDELNESSSKTSSNGNPEEKDRADEMKSSSSTTQPPPPPPQQSSSTASPPPPPPPVPEIPVAVEPPQGPQHHFQKQQEQQPHIVTSESSLSALKVRAEKEAELRQVEEYWQGRVQRLREHQLSSQAIDAEKFKETVAAVDKMFLKLRNKPICQESRNAVLRCYKENSKTSLNCSQLVSEFSKCVASARLGQPGID